MKTLIERIVVGLLLLAGLLACSVSEKEAIQSSAGLDLLQMDTTTRAQDDFFTYANGNWLLRTQIPQDRDEWGVVDELRERNEKQILELLQRASESQSYPEGTDLRKALDFYELAMDSLRAEELGIEPIKPIWNRISSISSKNEIQNYLVEQELDGGGAFFFIDVQPVQTGDKLHVIHIGTCSLGLPDRDYYVKNDAKSREIRELYETHLTAMLQAAGVPAARMRREASVILKVETFLAKGMLEKLTPSINWPSYFDSLGVKADTVNVDDPGFLKEFDRALSLFSLDDLKSYLRWITLRTAAPSLSKTLVNESFAFNQRYVGGIRQFEPRWRRVLKETNESFGDAIGRLYVKEKFSIAIRADVLGLIDNCRLAFADRIKELSWLNDSTKQLALQKLKVMKIKVGYGGGWKTYSAMAIRRDSVQSSYYSNWVVTRRFAKLNELAKVGKPVDEKEWTITPQSVEVYYNPRSNELILPAAILQPPFYTEEADRAVNYGALGAMISREILKGFDEQGSRYDEKGNLRNWWTEEDRKKFSEAGKGLAQQQGRYEPLPGVFLQGSRTVVEDVRDLGGVSIAFDALQRYLRENDRPGRVDGFTPEQRFFLSWSSLFRTRYRGDYLKVFISTKSYSPAMFRVLGPLSNMPSFYDAFQVNPGDKMYREEKDRVQIW
jgi:putative endopeptidase